MAKFLYRHNGYEYQVEADDEKSADDKFTSIVNAVPKEKKASEKALEDTSLIDKARNSPTTYGKVDNILNYVFGYGNKVLDERVPGLKTMKEKVSPSLVKGVPIAGRFVPQTPELSEFEKEHPYVSKGLNIAGGTAATLPLAAGASMASGAGFLPQWAGQTAVAAPLNILDTLAQKGKNITDEDIKRDILMGAGTSVIPAGVTKIFGQTARKLPEDIGDFMKVGGSTLPSGAPKPYPWATKPASEISGTGMSGLSPDAIRTLGGLAGGAAGWEYGHSMDAILAGLVGGPYAAHALDPLLRAGGRVMQHPSTQDILRALNAQVHSETKDGQLDFPGIGASGSSQQ